MAAFGFEHGGVFAVLGEVGESGVPELVQRCAGGSGFEDLFGAPVGESGSSGGGAQVAGGGCEVGTWSAVADEEGSCGAAGDEAGEEACGG